MQDLLISIKKDRSYFLTVLFFILLFFWWIFIFIGGTKDAIINHIFGFIYGGFSVWGGYWGLKISREWGGRKSLIGKAILCLSIGLLFQAFGQYSFWYYNYVLKIEVPYPGIPDIGYFGTIPVYIYAAILFAKASGIKVSLQNFISQLNAILIPIIMLGISYILFLRNYTFNWSSPLKIFLDFGYPMGQAIYISIAILTFNLSRNILGGIMKNKILLIIIAFIAQYLADYIFVYFHDSYFPASFFDLLYLIAYFLMTLGLIQLKVVASKLQK
jgi:diguanylate cyclase